MKYEDLRKRIKTGDLLVWATIPNWKHPITAIQIWLVKAFTQSAFSHVGVAFWVRNRLMVIDATGKGVLLRPISQDLPNYVVHRKKVLSSVSIDWAFSKIGQKYSRFDAVLAYFSELKTGENVRWQCTELSNAIYASDGEHFESLVPSTFVDEAMVKWNTNLVKVEK